MIELRQVCFSYEANSKNALNCIDLILSEHKCTGIIGPNGAGKSTLLSLLSGLLTPNSGQLLIHNLESTQQAEFVQQQVALVPQEYAFYQDLTIHQNLKYFARLCYSNSSQVESAIQYAIEFTLLSEFIYQKVSQVSGGIKRRLNIAIALLKRPKLIFFDESTVGIDPASRELIIAMIAKLKQSGTTIVYTSHLLSEVETLCDQILILDHGKIIYRSDNSTSSYWLKLEFELALTKAQQVWLQSLGLQLSLDEFQASIELDSLGCYYQLAPKLLEQKLPIKQLLFSKDPLEQIYLNLMAKLEESANVVG